MHKIGRRVLLYLLVPRSTKYFIPSTITQLVATDEAASKTSKKNAATRRDELRASANEGFIKLAAEHGEEMIRDAGASLLLTEIMLYTTGGEYRIGSLRKPSLTPHWLLRQDHCDRCPRRTSCATLPTPGSG
jgi:pumilio homology domain family member 6